jgi:hypothetical protein
MKWKHNKMSHRASYSLEVNTEFSSKNRKRNNGLKNIPAGAGGRVL